MVLQEIGSVLRAPLLKSQLGDFRVGQGRVKTMQTAKTRHIRNSFNIENENGFHELRSGREYARREIAIAAIANDADDGGVLDFARDA